MAIVTSQIVNVITDTVRCPTHHVEEQRRSVFERHTDHLGNIYERNYQISDASANLQTILATHALELSAELVRQEIEENLKEVLS